MQSLPKKRNMSPLRAERLQRHWSQRELAERLGANVTSVKRWERHLSVPGPYFRLKLITLFGKSEDTLGLRDARSQPVSPVETSDSSMEQAVTCQEQSVPISITTSSHWSIPSLRNPYFIGRDELFRLLDTYFALIAHEEQAQSPRMLLQQSVALTGLGGIGKTQLAVEYAYRMHEQGVYTHTLWINAASEEVIQSSFSSMAPLLPAFIAVNEADQQKLVQAVKQWLEECPHRWLLIFDNADDLSLLPSYIPRYGKGSILLTTRVHAVGALATALDVDTMSIEEGTHLLVRRAQRREPLSTEESRAVSKLVVTLDAFPLALDQAAAYIEETGCSFATYLRLTHTYQKDLLARRGTQATNYPNSVATTWSLSFQQIQHIHPAAAQLLHLCAFLAPDSIPEELLRDGAIYWPAPLQQAVTNPLVFEQMLAVLLRVSFIKRLANNHLLSIHRLVQVVQVEMLDREKQRRWAERVVCAVNAVFPPQPRDDVASWPQCLRYLELVHTCSMLIQRYQVQRVEAAELLERAGIYLYMHASYAQSEALYLQALPLREELSGTQHPQIASILHHLGHLYVRQGKYEQAKAYLQRALAMREQQLGAYHVETTETLYIMGILSTAQGKYKLAKVYYHQALTIFVKQLGTHHAKTSDILNSLGLLYAEPEQGKYEMAEACYHQALAIREEHLGKHHTKTACTLNNLGLLYYKQGKYKLAETYYRQALVIFEELLGAQHPSTAQLLSYLAEMYRDQLEYEQAESLFVRALAIQECIWSTNPNHPDLARTLYGFACLYEAQDQLQRAIPLYQRALTIREHAYGFQHRKTHVTREDLLRVLHLWKGRENVENRT